VGIGVAIEYWVDVPPERGYENFLYYPVVILVGGYGAISSLNGLLTWEDRESPARIAKNERLLREWQQAKAYVDQQNEELRAEVEARNAERRTAIGAANKHRNYLEIRNVETGSVEIIWLALR
jgi:hypothetical protein